ncbi:MAG TPA: RagB/SusD family nutrient uptake outer membrane protein [Puia sp.]|nr:RagB/SusD family nutrient uptake outer membrane protein [Puia sp.]
MKLNYILLIGAVLLISSCSKSYLNRTPYNAAPYSTAIQSESDMQLANVGMYSALRNTDLYGRTLPVKGDLMADNSFVTTANSGRYISLNSYAFANSDSYAAAIWSNAYIAIKYANTIINSKLPDTAANIGEYIGEAYAVRALMHFELVRNFAHPYTMAPDDPGVPIVTLFDSTALPARNTVREVYTQVINDLEKAYSLMSVYRGTAYFSKYAARALEARVYQNMGDWPDALTMSLDVINNGGWSLLKSSDYVSPSGNLGTAASNSTYTPGGYWANPGVQSATKNETLFEVASDLANNNGFDQIGFIYLQLGGGYGDMMGTDTLYALYAATDVRAGLYVRAPAKYRSGQGGNINLNYKYSNAAGSGDKDDTKVLRLADIILIAAEAYYNAGDYTNANSYLNMVAQKRDLSFAGWNDTGAQVLEDILIERRKELAFEGSRFWDLVRLQRSWTKIGNQSPMVTISVSPGNIGLIFPIPVTELNANPNIKQNPGY